MEFIVDENLEQIFSYLKQSALINASLVCRRWSEVIQNSSLLLKQLDLIILVQPDNIEYQSVIPNGKYRNLTMTLQGNVVNLSTEIIEDLKAQSKCIRNATLVNFDRINSIQTLSVIRNITKLVISDYRHDNDVLGVIDLPRLRDLELINSLPFAEVINSQNLNILKIYDKNVNQNDFSALNAILNNFLSKSHNLKDLTLSSIQIPNPNLKNDSFDFNLESLTIEDFSFDEENLVEFLVKQKNSLKKLAILNDSPKPIISTFIFLQLTLTELEIDVRIIPSYYNRQGINRTVKKLTIRSNKAQDYVDGGFINFMLLDDVQMPQIHAKHAIIKVISICIAAEEFTILECIFNSLLKHINRNIKNLKVLRLKTIPFKFISSTIKFDKFKTLEVIEIDKIESGLDAENCNLLVLKCPNLKTLKINFMERNIFTSNFFIKIVTKSKNLREIHIGVRCIFTLDMISAVMQAKDLGHPLESISFLFCLIDDKVDKNDAFMDGLKLNFQQSSNKLFSSMINETKLGRMKREIDEKHKDIKNQRACGIQRKLEIEIYKHAPHL